ncbi:acetylglutamate kinase [Lacticaseibacillus baoqingensis]|uniref:Acetylglutamate kinase n=1 Tax=Lacticaseibacillus baoqingensis TaxID=2486013 RepID=A0ABW4E5J0_9LACO|nr:acetylglutamate kinase [Lacticaseibacillus baoqingensis]
MQELIIVKLGGNAATQLSPAFFAQLHAWHDAGKQVLLIHGGGPQINAWSEKFGLKPVKKAGIRVTDAATLQVTQAVLIGVVQPQLCLSLSQHGLPALGLNTTDEHLLVGDYLDQAIYGQVGAVKGVNAVALKRFLTDHIGVLAPLAQTEDGTLLNVNADMAAAAVATAMHATKLVLLTDVPGVLANGAVVPKLSPQKAAQLIATNVITKGMQPKIEAAAHTAQVVHEVVITDALEHAGTIVEAAIAG